MRMDFARHGPDLDQSSVGGFNVLDEEHQPMGTVGPPGLPPAEEGNSSAIAAQDGVFSISIHQDRRQAENIRVPCQRRRPVGYA